MKTRCPYHACLHEFEIDEYGADLNRASNGFVRTLCPSCRRPATFKSLDLILKLEKKLRTMGNTSAVSELLGNRTGTTGAVEADIKKNATTPAHKSSNIPIYALLDDLRSLHNVGSIFRTADAFSLEEIILCGITGTPDQASVRKTSLSAEAHMPWQYNLSALEAIRRLKEKGVKIISLEKTSESLDLTRMSEHVKSSSCKSGVCIVVGNEVSGVSEEVLACSDYVLHIPMLGTKESLNVAVAFGIAAYTVSQEALRWRVPSPAPG